MKIPKRIEPLVEEGLVDTVVRQLMSGKEATVYIVTCGDELRCAKVYKEAHKRSFKKSVAYTEGRKLKNSRRSRAVEMGTRYGRKASEDAWQSAEVHALYRLAAAGVKVPTPYHFHEGVLLMEMVTDADGDAAPRLNDITLEPEVARAYHQMLIMQVVRMLCAGVIHGDLSEYNVLVGADGPVIIDLPQAIDAAGNNHAWPMLERDINNLASYFGRFAPEILTKDYAIEIWSHYENATLTPEIELTGRVKRSQKKADVSVVMREIEAARKEEEERQRHRLELEQ